jgi:hypothetical protein
MILEGGKCSVALLENATNFLVIFYAKQSLLTQNRVLFEKQQAFYDFSYFAL